MGLTNDAAVSALQRRRGTRDGAVGAAAALTSSRECGAGAASRGRRRAAGQAGTWTDSLGHGNSLRTRQGRRCEF